jgi:hypothetical protein
MEKVGGLVPVNPHAPEIVSKEIVEGVSRKKRQAIRNPVGLVWVIIVVRLGALAKITDRLRALIVSSRPYAEADAVESLGRVLL